MSLAWVILIVLGLVLLTAFYVAAEISIAGSRRSRMQQLSEEGNARARLVLRIIAKPSLLSAYIYSCQISITICSILLGFVGQGWLAYRLEPVILRWGGSPATASSVAVAATLSVLSLAQVFFGELIPKNIGIRLPEQLGMATVRPLMAYHAFFTPFLYVFNAANKAVLRLAGMRISHQHGLVLTPEEIRRLARESQAEGSILAEEQQWIDSTLRIDEMKIGHIMTARASIFAAPMRLSLRDWTALLVHSPYSRMPIFGRDLDDLQGTAHLLDLLCCDPAQQDKADILHPIPSLSQDMALDDGLRWMQQRRIHMVRVTGSDGSTVGIATLEELFEAVVGDIEDEFDAEQAAFRFQDAERLCLDARIPDENMAHFLGLSVPETRRRLRALALSPRRSHAATGLRVETQRAGRPATYSVPFEPTMMDRVPWLRLAS